MKEVFGLWPLVFVSRRGILGVSGPWSVFSASIVMKKLIFVIVVSFVLGVGSVAAQRDYCFQSDSSKARAMVSFTVTNNRIEGIFNQGDRSGKTSGTNTDFTGTKKGNLLTIEFKGEAPYRLAPGTRRIVWTIRSARIMTIPMYGRYYKTRRVQAYTAVFGPCADI